MLHLLKNAMREPSIFPEAANWLFTCHVLRKEPTRAHHGVRIGRFVISASTTPFAPPSHLRSTPS